MGTAPLSPLNAMNDFSARVMRTLASVIATTAGRITSASAAIKPKPSSQSRASSSDRLDGRPERDEHDHLGESSKRALEPFDLGLVGQPRVADKQPGEEHRQKPGAMGNRRRSVHDAREHECQDRVKAFAGQA